MLYSVHFLRTLGLAEADKILVAVLCSRCDAGLSRSRPVFYILVICSMIVTNIDVLRCCSIPGHVGEGQETKLAASHRFVLSVTWSQA